MRNSAFYTYGPECVVVFSNYMIYTLCNLNMRLKTIQHIFIFIFNFFFVDTLFLTTSYSSSFHSINIGVIFVDRLKIKLKVMCILHTTSGGSAGYFNDYKLNAGFVLYTYLHVEVVGTCLWKVLGPANKYHANETWPVPVHLAPCYLLYTYFFCLTRHVSDYN